MPTPPHVLIIGAGSTGAALAYDLAQRGLRVTLVERGEIASGTTGRNHCLLHSGGRYAVTDPQSALECIEENRILRTLMPAALELNDGLFVAIDDSDMAFKPRFIEACGQVGIPTHELTPAQALQREPHLNPRLRAAVQVPDGVFEPYRFCLAFLAGAQRHGARIFPHHRVTALHVSSGTATSATVHDLRADRQRTLAADLIVNAAGPWAGQIAALAGISVPVLPTAGVMVTVTPRLCQAVINRLNQPGDGDIVVPQRATVILGTTSWVVDDPDGLAIPAEHVARMRVTCAELVPAVAHAPARGVMAVARPLIGQRGADERAVSRTFDCFDHAAAGVQRFMTISGGKTTTARAMAAKSADLICAQLGVSTPCRTHATALPAYRAYHADAW